MKKTTLLSLIIGITTIALTAIIVGACGGMGSRESAPTAKNAVISNANTAAAPQSGMGGMNDSMMNQMMKDPAMMQQMMDQMMQNPEMMRKMMTDPKMVEMMTRYMNENADEINKHMELMMSDADHRRAMVEMMRRDPSMREQMRQIIEEAGSKPANTQGVR
jgi:hypothetical protein